ncbi:MAG: 50S ribosomal protein L19 [Parachlamydiaceae bacterium]
MSKHHTIQKLEQKQLKKNVEDFRVGDTIRVHTRIVEGEKERTQIFSGTVIARKGTGLSETFSVHRVAYGQGVIKVFPLHSPRISKIEVVKEGKVRRSKLNYLRGTSGKAAKVKGRVVARKQTQSAGTIQPVEQVEEAQVSSEA